MKDPAHLLPSHPDQTVVLIVDDEVMVVNIARIALEADGHFVLTADNGEEALQLSRKFAGAIHVLVSDVVMPEMDGIELQERLTAERPGIKVLLISGQVDSTSVNCPILRKPFHIDVLKERVRQLLDSAVAGGVGMKGVDRLENAFPIIPHETTGADCRGCIVPRAQGSDIELVCNECGAVVGVVQVDVLRNMVSMIPDVPRRRQGPD